MIENNERFVIKEKFGTALKGGGLILVDKETGVNYLWVKAGYAGGITPLLNEEGKPIITKS